jgi:hypothetical protein
MLKSSVLILGSGLFVSVFSIIVESPLGENLTYNLLAQSLIGSGFTVSNAKMKGSEYSFGTYTDALVESQGNEILRQGLVLSTGDVSFLNTGINSVDNIGSSEEYGGDVDLDHLLFMRHGSIPDRPVVTFDATTFEFDFTLDGSTPIDVSMWHVFGSDEYNEYVVPFHDDLFAIFLDDSNYSHVPGAPNNTFISVNSINDFTNSEYYNDNVIMRDENGKVIRDESGIPLSPFPTEMDGFTTPLTTAFSITDNEIHHLKIVIANTGDNAQDSWLLISGTNNLRTKEVPEPSTSVLIFFGIIFIISSQNKYISRQLKSCFKR